MMSNEDKKLSEEEYLQIALQSVTLQLDAFEKNPFNLPEPVFNFCVMLKASFPDNREKQELLGFCVLEIGYEAKKKSGSFRAVDQEILEKVAAKYQLTEFFLNEVLLVLNPFHWRFKQ